MHLFLLIFLLAGCSTQGALAPAHTIPKVVVMEGLEGSLPLRVGTYVAWRVDVSDGWLKANPSSGVGPKVIQLSASFTGEVAEQPEYTGNLTLLGDVEATVEVRLPLVRVVGAVVEGGLLDPQAMGMGTRAISAQAELETQGAQQTEILVKYRRDLRAVALPQGVRVLSHDQVGRVIKLSTSSPVTLLQHLYLDPNVEWAEVNGRVTRLGEPTDQFYPQQWYLRNTGARFTYLQTYPNPITVAVIDTGVRYDHPDLVGRLWQPGEGAYDFVGDASSPADPCALPEPDTPGDTDPTDPCDLQALNGGSHGTHVTGIMVATSGTFTPACPTCTDSGIVGMAHNAPIKVLPLRVLDPGGSGTFENVALAIRYAAGIPVQKAGQTLVNPQPAQVINLSLGSRNFSHIMCEAVFDAVARGVLVVAAAGNAFPQVPGQMFYPASCPGAISVAATDRSNQVAFYSQQNSRVDVAAPGGNTNQPGGGILSTTWNYTTNLPNYTFYMGTSQATPQVAAALAMLLSSGRASTAGEAWNLLRANLTDLGAPGRDDAYGHGLLNLPGAFAWTLPRGDFVISFSGPSSRQIPVVNGQFQTYLLPGRYLVTACRDDSGNGLCDNGEPKVERLIQVGGRGTLDLGTIQVGP